MKRAYGRSKMTTLFSMVSILTLVTMPAIAAPPRWSSGTMRFDLPSQGLGPAMIAFARQAGVQIAVNPEDVRGYHSQPLSGSYTPAQALSFMLAAKPFSSEWVSGTTLVIKRRRRLTPVVMQKTAEPSAETPLPATEGPLPLQNGGLEDIIVTARRRAERLQDTPVSVTSLSGAFIENNNLRDVVDIQRYTPNLYISKQGSSITASSVFIRGIGNQEPSSVSEQGVGIYFNGVYVARSAGSVFDVIDLERIEVLRGPQGTLFGRNSVGGAIQLVPRRPGDHFGIEAKGGYATYNDWFVKGRVDTGELGTSGVRASISYAHHARDGFTNNVLAPSSDDPGAERSDTVYAALTADLGDLKVDYGFDFNHREGSPVFQQVVATTTAVQSYFSNSPALGGDPFLASPKRLSRVYQRAYPDRSGDLRRGAIAEIQGHALSLTYTPNTQLTLKSITGYRRFFQDTILTLSGQGNLLGQVRNPVTGVVSVQQVNLFTGNNAPQKQYQISQEAQALLHFDNLSFILGHYYFYENAQENNRQALTIVLPGTTTGLNLRPFQAFKGSSESMALFGQATYRPSALDGRLELTAGGRYTSDTKHLLLRGDVKPESSGRVTNDNLSWLFSASYKFTDDILGYARASTGYRSGGINPRTSTINIFKPEKAMALEIGLKSELLDRHLRVNVAAFQTRYNDLQVQQFTAGSNGATSLIVNAGKVVLSGFEGELTAVPTKDVVFEASLGYTTPDYKTFLYRDPATNSIIDVSDEAHLPSSAKLNSHIGAQYTAHTSGPDVVFRVDYSYRGRMFFFALDRVNRFNKNISAPPDHDVSARVSVTNFNLGPAKAEASAWVTNLTDSRKVIFGTDFGSLGFASAIFKKPRAVGVDLKLSY